MSFDDLNKSWAFFLNDFYSVKWLQWHFQTIPFNRHAMLMLVVNTICSYEVTLVMRLVSVGAFSSNYQLCVRRIVRCWTSTDWNKAKVCTCTYKNIFTPGLLNWQTSWHNLLFKLLFIFFLFLTLVVLVWKWKEKSLSEICARINVFSFPIQQIFSLI